MQEQYHRFQQVDTEWVAISTDSPDSIRQMRDRHRLTFRLFTDGGGGVARRYRCMWSKEGEFNEPAVFLMDKNGVLLYQALVSTANGLASAADVLEHLLWRMENGRM